VNITSARKRDSDVRSYLIDELHPEAVQRLTAHLDEQGLRGSLEGIYWVEVPHELLSPVQSEHYPECGPYVFSLEAGKTWVKLELLVRSRGTFRCHCSQYASAEQRAFILDHVDRIFDALQIQT
jgi:hypothetical protein